MERYVILKPVQFKGKRYRIGDQVSGSIVRFDRAEALIRMKVIARAPEPALKSATEGSLEPAQKSGQEPDVSAASDPEKEGKKKGASKKEG